MKIIDGDSHFVEPLDLWERYLEPKYRDRAVRVDKDPATGDYRLIINGKAVPTLGIIAGMAGYGQKEEGRHYTELDPTRALNADWQDMGVRVRFLDAEGIDAQVIYPSLALAWGGMITDQQLAAAHCRAYNTWAFEITAAQKGRLYPAAHIWLGDVPLAVQELKRAAKLGCRTAFVLSMPANGKSFGHPDLDPIWATIQDLDMCVAIHITFHPGYGGAQWYSDREPDFYFVAVNILTEPRMALTTMVVEGVFERFPKLRVATIESKSGWVGDWLERLDHFFYMVGKDAPMKRKASEYFARNIWVCGEPEEKMFPHVVQVVGDSQFFVGSDYPHSESYVDPVRKARDLLSMLPAASVEKILGTNASKFYGI